MGAKLQILMLWSYFHGADDAGRRDMGGSAYG